MTQTRVLGETECVEINAVREYPSVLSVHPEHERGSAISSVGKLRRENECNQDNQLCEPASVRGFWSLTM